MGLLDLDKIIVQRTVIGIRCTSCGGNLHLKKISFGGRLIRLVSFGMIKPKNYACESCGKKYVLI